METHYFENYASEGNLFLNKVAVELGDQYDKGHAFRVVQAVFHALRDRISVEESMHFISELPMVLKAVYVTGWNISQDRKNYSSKDEFLREIYEETRTAEVDFGSNPIEEVQAVFRVVKDWVSEGEIKHVKSQLPKEIAQLI